MPHSTFDSVARNLARCFPFAMTLALCCAKVSLLSMVIPNHFAFFSGLMFFLSAKLIVGGFLRSCVLKITQKVFFASKIAP